MLCIIKIISWAQNYIKQIFLILLPINYNYLNKKSPKIIIYKSKKIKKVINTGSHYEKKSIFNIYY